MSLVNRRILVVGGSRGLGLGIVEALVARGAEVSVLARSHEALEETRRRLGVVAIEGDATDAARAREVLRELSPDVVVLNAGLPPPMEAIDSQGWESFSAVWNHDVKAGLFWIQAALTMPLAHGSRVLITSSGAALNGSPLSGGYAGAKRMLWLMADYANARATELGIHVRFQVLVPRQMVGGTGTGDAGSRAYAAKRGVSPETFLAGFGTPMPPRAYGELVADVIADPARAECTAFGFGADSGITALGGA